MEEFKRGDVVEFCNPVGEEDKRVARMKRGRCGVFYEYVPQGYARVFFYGDAKDLTYLVHPESIKRTEGQSESPVKHYDSAVAHG